MVHASFNFVSTKKKEVEFKQLILKIAIILKYTHGRVVV